MVTMQPRDKEVYTEEGEEDTDVADNKYPGGSSNWPAGNGACVEIDRVD